MKAGPRDTLVVLFRAGAATHNGYNNTSGQPVEIGREYAQVIFGSGRERRERRQASQTQSSEVATFRMLANDTTRTLTTTDTVQALGSKWDIFSSVPLGRDGWEVTAARS